MTRLVVRAQIAAGAAGLALAAPAFAQTVPDNGAGTATVPPPTLSYVLDPNPILGLAWQISSGLPVGSPLLANAVWGGFTYGSDAPGGLLGGNRQDFQATLTLPLVGTGVFLGYSHTVTLPLNQLSANQTDTAPRGAPYSSPQVFANDVFRLLGQTLSDPDFDLLRVVAGTDFGMSSPGQTMLTDLGGGQWAIDSFFDITYRIDFIGKPGRPFAGYSGSTTAMTRMRIVPAPVSCGLLALGGLAALRRRRC